MSIIEKGQYAFSDASLPILYPDPVINTGSQFCFDMANAACLASGATLSNGLVIPNLVSGAPSASLLLASSSDLSIRTGANTVKGIQKLNNNNLSGVEWDTGTQYFQTNYADDLLFSCWAFQPFYQATLAALYSADTASPYAKYAAAIVTSDGTGSNNGTWTKTGAGTGSGNWTQLDNVATPSTGNWLLRKMSGTGNTGEGIYAQLYNGYTSDLAVETKISNYTGTADINNTDIGASGSRGGLYQVAWAKCGTTEYIWVNGVLQTSGGPITAFSALNAAGYMGIQVGSSYTAMSGMIMSRWWAEDLTVSAAVSGLSTYQQAASQVANDYSFVTSNSRFT